MTDTVICSVEDCPRIMRAKGFCYSHYKRFRKGTDLNAPFRDLKNTTIKNSNAPVGQRWCSRGSHYQLLDNFYQKTGTKSGLRGECKDCTTEYAQENKDRINSNRRLREKENPQKVFDDSRRRRLQSHFNITPEEYENILKSQGGVCAICKTDNPGTFGNTSFAIDHDHACCPGRNSCGKCIRGLVCKQCNLMLGNAKDDPDILRAGMIYLDEHSKRISNLPI